MIAPAASVAIISEFDEVDGAVVFAGPPSLDYSVLMRINLNECPRTDQRIQCVVLGSHISIENIAACGMLCEKKRHLTQALEHPMDEVRPFERGFVRQFHRSRDDRLHLQNGARAEVSVRKRD